MASGSPALGHGAPAIDPAEVLPAQGIDRRHFLRSSVALGLGALTASVAGGVYNATRSPGEETPVSIRRNGNTTIIEKKGLGTSYLLYNLHFGGKNPDPLPEDADAATFELLADKWTQHPKSSLNASSQDRMNRQMYLEMQRRGKPILLTSPYLDDRQGRFNKGALELGLAAFGGWGVYRGQKNIRQWFADKRGQSAPDDHQDGEGNQEQPHRTKWGLVNKGVGPVAAGLTLALPTLASAARLGSLKAEHFNALTAKLNRFSRLVHQELFLMYPESYIFALIMTHKIETLMKMGRYRKIATIVGGQHDELETEVARLSWEERLRELLLLGQELKDAIDAESLYTIQEMVPGKTGFKAWEEGDRIEVPELRELTRFVSGESAGMSVTPELASAYRWYLEESAPKARTDY